MRLGLAAAATLALASLSSVAQAIEADRDSWARKPEIAAALTVLDAWIAATVAQREQPGLSIGIVYDQDLVWTKAYGFADVARRLPATPSTLYRIASISKLFTSTAIMQLRDAGKLRLDDPVRDRLPWFSIKKTESDGPAITIRHLITHTSGLPREVSGVNWSDLSFPSRDDMMRVLPGQETVFPPDTEWKYSNLAVSLAGEIVAEISGEPWPQYVERHILGPLGMAATRVVPERGLPGLSVGYGRRVPGRERDVEPFVDIGAESPAGSLASNVEDLAKFVALQLRDGPAGGRQVLRGSTLREMHRVQWLRPDWQSGWGLGFSVRRVGDQVRIGHGGSLPGQRTQIEIAPAQKLGVIVLTNANDGDPLRYVNQAFTLLSPAAAKVMTVPETPKVPEPRWQRYVGRYAWKFSEMQIQILNGELTMIVPEADNPWSSRMILRPVGPNTFRMVGTGPTYEPIGELLTFEMDDKEKVTRVRTPYFYWLPME
ncbi:MAG: serine hydrolase [Acidobacteria bacterium]|nr:MAG: serine hydrolase [Acidobacteriota bacterium]